MLESGERERRGKKVKELERKRRETWRERKKRRERNKYMNRFKREKWNESE
jgi:hypothetical protein